MAGNSIVRFDRSEDRTKLNFHLTTFFVGQNRFQLCPWLFEKMALCCLGVALIRIAGSMMKPRKARKSMGLYHFMGGSTDHRNHLLYLGHEDFCLIMKNQFLDLE